VDAKGASGSPVPQRLRRARFAVVVYFAMLGMANGVWLSRIPAVKASLYLSDGVLGVALLSAPAGLVVVVVFSSRIVHHFGSKRPTAIAGVCAALMPIALGVAPGLAALMVALFVFGLASGMLDVGMNSQAVLVEREYRRPLMTSFHACYSFGGLAGALLGSVFASAGIGPALNFTTVGIPLAGCVALAGRWLVTDKGGNGPEPASAARPRAAARADAGRADAGRADAGRADAGWAGVRSLVRSWTPVLVVMALLAACSLLGEGAAEGWSAVYLHDNLGTSAALAALGYAGFSVAMAAGRLSGDRLAARFGPLRLMRWCGLVAAAGLTLALLSSDAAGAIAGFAVFGAGLSCTFPQQRRGRRRRQRTRRSRRPVLHVPAAAVRSRRRRARSPSTRDRAGGRIRVCGNARRTGAHRRAGQRPRAASRACRAGRAGAGDRPGRKRSSARAAGAADHGPVVMSPGFARRALAGADRARTRSPRRRPARQTR
jgi:fucose permease